MTSFGRKVEITTGLDTCTVVRGYDFLPGLVLHKAPDCSPGAVLFNVSHVISGLAVARHLETGDIERAREILGAVSWAGIPEGFVTSEPHKTAHQEVMRLSNRERSERQEKKIAKDTGGRKQPASGARWGHRRDVILPAFLIEAKTTERTSYRIDLKDLEYLRKQAFGCGRVPAYLVGVAGHEEVAVLPYPELLPSDLEGATTVSRHLPTALGIPIDVNLAKATVDGEVRLFNMSIGCFAAMSYERFLYIAKAGISPKAGGADADVPE